MRQARPLPQLLEAPDEVPVLVPPSRPGREDVLTRLPLPYEVAHHLQGVAREVNDPVLPPARLVPELALPPGAVAVVDDGTNVVVPVLDLGVTQLARAGARVLQRDD